MDIAKVERVYTNYAGVYDHIFGKIFHESRESAVRNLRIAPNEEVLEVGVGTGIALPFYPKNCRVVGIDLSPGMLEKARARGLDVSHVHIRHIMPFPANLGQLLKSFDKVLVPEMNAGQLKTMLRDQFLVDAQPLNKVSGQPFTIAEIEAAIDEAIL